MGICMLSNRIKNLTIHLDKNVMLCQILCDQIVCDDLNSDEYTGFNIKK